MRNLESEPNCLMPGRRPGGASPHVQDLEDQDLVVEEVGGEGALGRPGIPVLVSEARPERAGGIVSFLNISDDDDDWDDDDSYDDDDEEEDEDEDEEFYPDDDEDLDDDEDEFDDFDEDLDE